MQALFFQLRLEHNGWHFADNILKLLIFLDDKVCILVKSY